MRFSSNNYGPKQADVILTTTYPTATVHLLHASYAITHLTPRYAYHKRQYPISATAHCLPPLSLCVHGVM